MGGSNITAMDPEARAALESVSAALNVHAPSDREVLSWARPDLASVADTYRIVNRDLMDSLGHGTLTRIDHVTRVGRVLLDSTHRQVLLRAADETEPRILPSLSYVDTVRGGADPTAWSFLASCRPSWEGLDWLELVDILFVIGSGAVKLQASDYAMPVQFSIFDGDRALLQSPTNRPAPEKYVWYVESPGLTAQLAVKQAKFASETQPIDAASFNKVRRWLLDYDLHRFVDTVLTTNHTIGKSDSEAIADWRLEMLGLWRRVGADSSRRELTALGAEWRHLKRSQGEGGTGATIT